MAPGHDDDAAARRADPGQLAHKAPFVRHVLAALKAPDQVETAVAERLLQRVSYLHARVRACWSALRRSRVARCRCLPGIHAPIHVQCIRMLLDSSSAGLREDASPGTSLVLLSLVDLLVHSPWLPAPE